MKIVVFAVCGMLLSGFTTYATYARGAEGSPVCGQASGSAVADPERRASTAPTDPTPKAAQPAPPAAIRWSVPEGQRTPFPSASAWRFGAPAPEAPAPATSCG